MNKPKQPANAPSGIAQDPTLYALHEINARLAWLIGDLQDCDEVFLTYLLDARIAVLEALLHETQHALSDSE